MLASPLRQALGAHLGQVLTPEIAAAIEVAALAPQDRSIDPSAFGATKHDGYSIQAELYVASADFIVVESLPTDAYIYYDWPTGTIVRMPDIPDETGYWSFDYDTKTWVSALPLAELKTLKKEEINSWRTEANQSSFPFAGKEVACDPLSRGDIDAVTDHVALFGEFPIDFPGAWKVTDNTYIPIPDIDTWKNLIQAMTAQGTANFLHAQALKAQAESATTREALDAIQW